MRIKGGMKIAVETSIEIKKLKMELPYGPVIPLLGIHWKEPEMLIRNKYRSNYVHCSGIYKLQDLEATQVFISIYR